MSIAESMRELTGQIIASHNVRTKSLGDLVLDSQKTLKDFAEERQRMSAKQSKNLLDLVNGLSKSVDDTLKGFRKNRKRMSDEQAGSLADFAKRLADNTKRMLTEVLPRGGSCCNCLLQGMGCLTTISI